MALLKSALLVVLLAGAASVSAAATLPEALKALPDLSELAGLLEKVRAFPERGARPHSQVVAPCRRRRAAGAAVAESPTTLLAAASLFSPAPPTGFNPTAEPRCICGRGLLWHAAGAHQPGKAPAARRQLPLCRQLGTAANS